MLNVVVLTAAVSAYNSGLYSEGRMLYALARQGNAPAFLAKTNKQGAPYLGIFVSSAVTAFAVLLNFLFPGQVFLWLVSISAIACVFNWGLIVYTQMRFRRRIGAASVERLQFKMPWFPVTNDIVFGFLALVVVLRCMLPQYQPAVIIGPFWALILFVSFRVKTWLEKKRGTYGRPTVADELAEQVTDHYREQVAGTPHQPADSTPEAPRPR